MHCTALHFTSLSLIFSTDPVPSCDGGNYFSAFGAVAKAGGVTYDKAYPYDIAARQCDKTKNDYVVTVTGYHRLEGQQNMINHVLNGGTLVVAVDASAMGSYTSGIFSSCPATYANHAMQIVGVNVDEGYWILRNSWASWWGDQGFLKLALVCVSYRR
jgi:cathepsin L